PLEERRARAVSLRRTDPDLASGLGSLDPTAIQEVRRQAWPDARDADEAHDALLTLCVLPEVDAGAWQSLLDALVAAGRTTVARIATSRLFVAAERAPWVRAAIPEVVFSPEPPAVAGLRDPADGDEALTEIVRGWMSVVGPTTVEALAERLTLPAARIEAALARLEADGQALRGSFLPGS